MSPNGTFETYRSNWQRPLTGKTEVSGTGSYIGVFDPERKSSLLPDICTAPSNEYLLADLEAH
jgi:hypothetical protein